MKGVMRPMTSRTIRRSSSPKFSDLDYRSFNFGDSVHESYHIYKNEFSSILANTLGPNVPFYGGYNFISYAYGPTVWNSDFRYKGQIDINVGTASHPLPGDIYRVGYEPQWSSVIGCRESGGLKYRNYDRSSVTVSDRPYFLAAPEASSIYALSGVWRAHDYWLTNEIVSGIQLRQPYLLSKSFAVVNNADRDTTLNAALGYSITLFSPDIYPVEIVVPFDPQYASNPKFNKLRPQSQFKVDIAAKTQWRLEAQKIAVELTTSGVLDDNGQALDWRFCWRDEKWIPATSVYEDHVFTKILPVNTRAVCPENISVQFHTQDIFTVKAIPCEPPFKSDDVHTSATGYLLTVKSASQGTVLNDTVQEGIEIHEISVVDTVLNQSMNYFNSKEIDTIYTFWDGLTTTSYSRDETYSASSFEVSGGSKAEYVELLGGTTNSGSTTQVGYTWMNFDVED